MDKCIQRNKIVWNSRAKKCKTMTIFCAIESFESRLDWVLGEPGLLLRRVRTVGRGAISKHKIMVITANFVPTVIADLLAT